MPLLTERHCTILCFLDSFFPSSKTAEQNYIGAGLTKGHKMKRVVSERKKDIRTCIYVNIYAALIGNV